jgi:hypothetical protein
VGEFGQIVTALACKASFNEEKCFVAPLIPESERKMPS